MSEVKASEKARKNAAERACKKVKDGMAVGLGTGKTAEYAVKCLGRRVVEDGLDIVGVPTSYATESLAIQCGIPLVTLDQEPLLDLVIDGADQVDSELNMIKGGGAAHAKEKIVSMSAEQVLIVIDYLKLTGTLTRAVPVEVLPFARKFVEKAMTELGAKCELRTGTGKIGPVISENGNIIIDCDFGNIPDPAELAARMCMIPGIVAHGIFLNADKVYVGYDDRVEIRERR